MINFRFHLVSLVAVFLALGVGVAMGASFVDRATVDTLRARVDDLSEGYQRRGNENDALRDQLAESDAQSSALAGPGSEALDDKLSAQRVVVVAPDGFSDEVLDSTSVALAAADAYFSGSITIEPEISMSDDDVLASTRDRLGLRSGTAEQVRDAAIDHLGAALGVLAEDATGAVVDGSITTTTAERPNGTSTTPPLERATDVVSARVVLEAMTELGLIAIDQSQATQGATFPDTVGVRYVMVVPADATGDAAAAMVPLARATSNVTGAVVTAAEARAARPEGQATTTSQGEPKRGDAIAELRESDSAERLSTVDNLEEPNGRLALVFAVTDQRSGGVGHYGSGTGATAPFPTTPAG